MTVLEKQLIAAILFLIIWIPSTMVASAYLRPTPEPPRLTKFVPKPPSCCGDSICLMEGHHR